MPERRHWEKCAGLVLDQSVLKVANTGGRV